MAMPRAGSCAAASTCSSDQDQKLETNQKESESGERRVAELRGKKMAADGTVWYLAHWEGGDTEDDTWEQAVGLGSDEWMVSEWEANLAALRKPEISRRA